MTVFQPGLDPRVNDLLPLNPFVTRTKTIAIGPGAIAAGATQNMLTLTNVGPGVIPRIQFGVGPGNGSLTVATNNDLVRIYVDGESTPSISFDVGNLGLHYVPQGTALDVWCDHLRVTMPGSGLTGSNFAFGLTLTLPIPFKTGVRVDYTRDAGGGNLDQFWSDTSYVLGPRIPHKLFNRCVTFANRVTKNAAQLNNNTDAGGLEFLNLPVGTGPGHLVMHCMTTSNATNFTWSETNPVVYLDANRPNSGGTATPDVNGDGNETLFDSAWYFPVSPLSTPSAMFTAKGLTGNTNGMTAVADLLPKYGGIRFTDGCTFKWEPGQNVWFPTSGGQCTTSVDVCWNTFYYLDAP